MAIRPSTLARRQALFEEATAIIALEHPDPLPLGELARRLASSPRELQRAFAQAGEPSVRSYVRRVRIDHAAQLLGDGWTVRAAAHAVGYRQAAQFAKAFRRERGHLPGLARRSA